MKGLRNAIMILNILLVTGCTKSSFERDTFLKPVRVYDLAVEGGINTVLQDQFIRLTKPATSPDLAPAPISDASVVVNDSKVDIVFKETSTPGVYTARNRNDANYNKGYKLTIVYKNKTYSAVDTMRQVVNINDDFLPLSTRSLPDNTIQGVIPKHTFGYINPNKWYINYGINSFWQPSKFDQTDFYSYTHFLGSPNSLYPLNNLKREFVLKPDDDVWIFKISLSEKYAAYLYSVFMETDWSGLFSSVPVNVEGNISGNAQGYFSVSDVDFRRYDAREL